MSDAPALTLRRPRPAPALISLVAMIDVLLILLVFFMVTSTYLNLDMIPAVSQDSGARQITDGERAQPLLVRIGADGQPVIQGKPMSLEQFDALIRSRLNTEPTLPVMILPTGVARTQALVSVMDAATKAGARQVRVIRLEARP
ncbi:ExbD/TolR family protein [Sulfitobacter pacificus]|uniref:TolR-like protein n=1 Tax=Sulfitobacter pacificus TaxID=1499314 RepID=A0ABQ5VNW4_9RHOB|nr:biopolymer transporter ExbD [Sulfitobacter pacificus]GLQ28767.1 TolR-like protein [Sulfitobacter pacificus]